MREASPPVKISSSPQKRSVIVTPSTHIPSGGSAPEPRKNLTHNKKIIQYTIYTNSISSLLLMFIIQLIHDSITNIFLMFIIPPTITPQMRRGIRAYRRS